MRVAILTNEYPPYIFGGIGTFTESLAESLARRGIDVLVVAGYPKKSASRALTEDGSPGAMGPMSAKAIDKNQSTGSMEDSVCAYV